MSSIQRYIALSLSSGLAFDESYFSYEEIYKMCFGLLQGSIRVTLNRMAQQGRIGKIIKNGKVYIRLSSSEVRHIKKTFRLEPDNEKRWNGIWTIVVIPAIFYRKKEIRDKLKALKFGTVQKSVYISPYRWKDKETESKVWHFETKTVYPLGPHALANTIWHLDSLYAAYTAWMQKAQNYGDTKRGAGIEQFTTLIAQYEAILQDDPALPRGLLLPNWPVRAAQKLFIRLVKERFGSRQEA